MANTDKPLEEVLSCAECKHSISPSWYRIWAKDSEYRCNLEWEGNINISLVTGKQEGRKTFIRCWRRRAVPNSYGSEGLDCQCGPGGKQWEPKKSTPDNLMKLLKRE